MLSTDISAANEGGQPDLIRKIILAAMIALLLVMAGCDQNPDVQDNPPPQDVNTKIPDDKPEPSKNNPPSPPPKHVDKQPLTVTEPERTVKVKVYFPDEAGLNLVSVERQIKVSSDEQKYEAAIKMLMDEPKEKGLTGIFPKSAKLNGVTVKDGTAYVDFDNKLVENFVGGSTGEEFLVDSVVDTLTEFKEVKQVRFLIDGQEIETLSGHMDLTAPVKRRQ